MTPELQGYVTSLQLKSKFDLYVYLKLGLFFFRFLLLEDNLALPALIVCKYIWLMYLESCLGPVNKIMQIITVGLKHIVYIRSTWTII